MTRDREPHSIRSHEGKFLGLGKDALIDMIVQANVDADEKIEKIQEGKKQSCVIRSIQSGNTFLTRNRKSIGVAGVLIRPRGDTF